MCISNLDLSIFGRRVDQSISSRIRHLDFQLLKIIRRMIGDGLIGVVLHIQIPRFNDCMPISPLIHSKDNISNQNIFSINKNYKIINSDQQFPKKKYSFKMLTSATKLDYFLHMINSIQSNIKIQQSLMQENIVRQLISSRKKSGKHHTYIIKKQSLSLHNHLLSIDDSPPKMPTLKSQKRSRSEHKSIKKDKIYPFNQEQPFIVGFTPLKRQNLRIRELKTERNYSRKKYKSEETKVKTLNSNKSVDIKYKNQKKNMKSYLQFIRASNEEQYILKADFQLLRRKARKRSLNQLQKNIIQLFTSVFKTIFENISQNTPKRSRLIQQSCLYYLQCPQKARIQLLLSVYYPKLLHTKLRPYFVYQRQIIYIVFLLSKSNLIEKLTLAQQQSIKLSVKYIRESLQILMQPILELQGSSLSSINETFKLLKAIGEVQKKLVTIEREMNRIFIKSYQGLIEIESSLNELVNAKVQWPLQKLTQIEMQLSWKYFKIPPHPYLPSNPKSQKKYTLVLQLDNTLIHYDRVNKLLKYRPYLDLFLTKLHYYFEIVLYTLSEHEYTSIVVKQIQKVGKYFDFILSESHLILKDGSFVKDFSRLGRDQRKVVIVDSNRSQGKQFIMNYIQISVWRGQKNDRALHKLTSILENLQQKKVQDVRQYLRDLKYSLHMIDQQEQQKQN